MARAVARSPAKGPNAPTQGDQVAQVSDKWAASHGSGAHASVWGLAGAVGRVVHQAGTAAILASFPVIAIFL